MPEIKEKDRDWNDWYAWFPVTINQYGDTAWGMIVQRKLICAEGECFWKYRLKEDSKIFLEDLPGPDDWADESSYFHIDYSPEFKRELIDIWLKNHEKKIREEERVRAAEIIDEFFEGEFHSEYREKVKDQIINPTP